MPTTLNKTAATPSLRVSAETPNCAKWYPGSDVATNVGENSLFPATNSVRSRPRQHTSKSNGCAAKITMWLVQWKTVSLTPPQASHPSARCTVDGWLCFTLIWGFSGKPELWWIGAAQRDGHPVRSAAGANVILWQSVRSEGGFAWEEVSGGAC